MQCEKTARKHNLKKEEHQEADQGQWHRPRRMQVLGVRRQNPRKYRRVPTHRPAPNKVRVTTVDRVINHGFQWLKRVEGCSG